MYERMLDKEIIPSFEDLLNYSGDCKNLWIRLDKHLADNGVLTKHIRFPYGNHYGWSMNYRQKHKHICDVFAEKNAFNVHFKISNDAFESIYESLSDYSKEIFSNRYPCGNGGWLNYRVLLDEHLQDLVKLLQVKVNS